MSDKKHAKNGGSLPNAIINFEELADIIYGSLFREQEVGLDYENNIMEGVKLSKGFELNMSGIEMKTIEWALPRELTITGVNFGIDSIRNIGYTDTWTLYIDDEPTLKNIYVKEMYECKTFRQYGSLEQDSIVKIEFNNNSGVDKTVWFDIDYAV